MANTLEEALLLAANSTATENPPVVIENDLRTVTLPSNFLLGVYNDKDVNDVVVEMPRYYKDLDLSTFAISVNFVGADGTGDRYIVTRKTVASDKITFHWIVGRNAFLADGTAVFAFCLRKMSGSTVSKEFNTTVTRVPVLEGLETDITPTPEQQSSIDAAVSAMEQAVRDMQENVSHYPKIVDNYWYVWDANANTWVNTYVYAKGEVTQFDLEKKANTFGTYDGFTAGLAKRTLGPELATDNEAYFIRKSKAPKGAVIQKDIPVGGTIAWNQLANTRNYTNTATDTGTFLNLRLRHSSSPYFSIYSKDITVPENIEFISVILNDSAKGLELVHNGVTQNFQLFQNQSVELIKGHKFLFKCKLESVDPQTVGGVVAKDMQFIDLTQMFGSVIANYVYSIEQATPGAGVAWFKNLFPSNYYQYDAGSFISSIISAHNIFGFNLIFDSFMTHSYYDITDPDLRVKYSEVGDMCNSVPAIQNTAYYINSPKAQRIYIDVDRKMLGHFEGAGTDVTPVGTTAILINLLNYGDEYNNDVCLNFDDPKRNGEYEDPISVFYAYYNNTSGRNDIELRGIFKLKPDGSLYCDGEKAYAKEATRGSRFLEMALNYCNWSYNNVAGHKYFYANKSGSEKGKADEINNLICTKRYVADTYNNVINNVTDKTIALYNGKFYVYDSAYTDAAAFKASMDDSVAVLYDIGSEIIDYDGVYYSEYQMANSEGCEEYFYRIYGEPAVPVGHEAIYYADGVSTKAEIDGTYEDLTAGKAIMADNLETDVIQYSDAVPYQFRQSANGNAIGNRERLKSIVGGTVAWNQLVEISPTSKSQNTNGITFIDNRDGSYTFYTDENGATAQTAFIVAFMPDGVKQGRKYCQRGFGVESIDTYTIEDLYNGVLRYPTIDSAIIDGRGDGRLDARVLIRAGSVITTPVTVRPQISDLTQMFGTTIADYVYSLDQANRGAGIAKLKSWGFFDKDYYEYDAGTLKSVEGLISHDTKGFNQWDEEWEVGYIAPQDGKEVGESNKIRMKNYMPVLPNTRYYKKSPNSAFWNVYFDENKKYVGYDSGIREGAFITPANAHYIRSGFEAAYGTTYNHDVCFNLVSNDSKNGTYEPYQKHSYPLDSSLVLRGIPKLDAQNNLYFDGDVYKHDGIVERRYGIVDLGTLSWTKAGSHNLFWANLPKNSVRFTRNLFLSNSKYTLWDGYYGNASPDRFLYGIIVDNNIQLGIMDSSYTDAASFKAAMSGVMLVYELATPTIEQADPFQEVQICDAYGTEEFVTNSIVPVGHNTDYPRNLKKKLEELPDIPEPPTADGTYTLKATIAGGVPTLSWVQ